MLRLTRSVVLGFSLSFVVLSVEACSRHRAPVNAVSAPLQSAPEWFLNPPRDSMSLRGTATSVSPDLQASIEMAQLDARMQIARGIEARYEGLQKRFREQAGGTLGQEFSDVFSSAAKEITTTTLSGTHPIKQWSAQEGEKFRVYVLMEYSLAETNRQLLLKLKANEAAVARVRATKAFAELDAEVSRVEAAKAKK